MEIDYQIIKKLASINNIIEINVNNDIINVIYYNDEYNYWIKNLLIQIKISEYNVYLRKYKIKKIFKNTKL